MKDSIFFAAQTYCGWFNNLHNILNLDVKNILIESVMDNYNFPLKEWQSVFL